MSQMNVVSSTKPDSALFMPFYENAVLYCEKEHTNAALMRSIKGVAQPT